MLPPKNETFQIKNSDIFLMSTYNLRFWAEIRKIMYIPDTQVLLYKSGV